MITNENESSNITDNIQEKPTLPVVISQWQREKFFVNGTEIQLTFPADPDELLQLLEVDSTDRKGQPFDPYWGHLWPAAKKMADLISKFNRQPGTRVLELGCGSGLIGIAALAAGMTVTFSDNQPDALQLAAYNATQNGFQDYHLSLYDWIDPPEIEPFQMVIASDVLYEKRFHKPLLDVLLKVLTNKGEAWIADPGRSLLAEFLRTAQTHHFQIGIYDENLKQKSFPGIGHFQVIRLQKSRSGFPA